MGRETSPNCAPLVVSIGEPAGIGPDIVLKAWNAASTNNIPPFVLLCDPKHLADRAQSLGIDANLNICARPEAFGAACISENFGNALPVYALENKLHALPASPQIADSKGVVEAITTAVKLIHDNQAAGLVTLPINKKSLYDAGFDYPGHTEFLGALAAQWLDGPNYNESENGFPVMMLAGPKLRVVPITIHIPLREVPSVLTQELIVQTGRIVAYDLENRFGIPSPRLAFSGLNPHAGEGGALGHEDEAIIAPALNTLRNEGIDCLGPLPADTMFHDRARQGYDVALCMYHDQALIPAKALGFDDSVNVTLGLPFIRTSPDHGTAFDIAGTGIANPASFIASLCMAREMADKNS